MKKTKPFYDKEIFAAFSKKYHDEMEKITPRGYMIKLIVMVKGNHIMLTNKLVKVTSKSDSSPTAS